MNLLRGIKLLIFKKEEVSQKEIVFLFAFLAIALLVFVSAKAFNINLTGVGLWLFVISFSLLCLITWSMAGIAVLRSLFVVGASLSLMIFLAQTYCDLPEELQTARGALASLFSFGLLYVGFQFIQSIREELKKGMKTFDEIYKGKKPWVMVILFAFFVGLFLWQLYQVVAPIVSNLCIDTLS